MKNIGRLAAIAMCALAAGASSAQAMTFEVSKQLEGLKFTETSHLPKALPASASKNDCDGMTIDAETPAGKLLESTGWGVTGEAPLGDYTAVSFSGSFKAGDGAVCTIQNGAIGIFDGKSLVALLSQGKSGGDAIGSILALDGGSIRVLTGEETPYPEGDVHAIYDGFTLGGVAEADQVCGGKGTVPNVYGFSIDKARLKILKDGWKPLPLGSAKDGPLPGDREHGLVKAGVTEVQFCAGTGLANCEFDYTGPAGKLAINTIGEEEFPQVMGYGMQCTK